MKKTPRAKSFGGGTGGPGCGDGTERIGSAERNPSAGRKDRADRNHNAEGNERAGRSHRTGGSDRTEVAGSSSYRRIYAVVARIPTGRVATYGQVAELAGLPGHARQVGYALHALPEDTDLPWQRVINSRGEVSARSTFFAAAREGHQRFLLEEEDVVFDLAGRVDLRLYRWRPGERHRAAAAGSSARPRPTASSTSGAAATATAARTGTGSRTAAAKTRTAARTASPTGATGAAAKPTTSATSKPTTRAGAKPTAAATGKPANRAAGKTANRSAARQATSATKPANRATAETAKRSAARPTTRATTRPTPRVTTKPTTDVTAEPTPRTSAKPTPLPASPARATRVAVKAAPATASPGDFDPEAERIAALLRPLGSAVRAAGAKAYLKSELEFFGVDTPTLRGEARAWLRARPDLDRHDVTATVAALWRRPVHEMRAFAIELLMARQELLRPADLRQLEGMLRTARSWAYVDSLAILVVGPLVERSSKLLTTLDRWSTDSDFWLRRSALLALLRRLRTADLGDPGAPRPTDSGSSAEPGGGAADSGGPGYWQRFMLFADAMLEEREFFVRKAIGWVLREVGKRHPRHVVGFLAPRLDRVAGLTLREAVKHLPAADRRRLLPES